IPIQHQKNGRTPLLKNMGPFLFTASGANSVMGSRTTGVRPTTTTGVQITKKVIKDSTGIFWSGIRSLIRLSNCLQWASALTKSRCFGSLRLEIASTGPVCLFIVCLYTTNCLNLLAEG